MILQFLQSKQLNIRKDTIMVTLTNKNHNVPRDNLVCSDSSNSCINLHKFPTNKPKREES